MLSGVTVGDTIQFVTKVDNSQHGQPIQNVILKVTEVTNTHVKGINAMRALDMSGPTSSPPFRSYKIENIISETVWKLVA